MYAPNQVRLGNLAQFRPLVAAPVAGQQRWTWATFYQLPVPVENLEKGSYVRVEVVDIAQAEVPVALARAKLIIDKATINTEVQRIDLLWIQDEKRVHSTLEMESLLVKTT